MEYELLMSVSTLDRDMKPELIYKLDLEKAYYRAIGTFCCTCIAGCVLVSNVIVGLRLCFFGLLFHSDK